jgi:F1F0 ATPase subunit 2
MDHRPSRSGWAVRRPVARQDDAFWRFLICATRDAWRGARIVARLEMDVPTMNFMADAPWPLLVIKLCGAGFVGAIVGYCYFTALWWNVVLIDRGSTGRALFLLAARVAVLVLTLFILVRFGALALLGGAGGLLAARRVLVRRIGKSS